MKTKFNRILSSLLVMIMIFASVSYLIPIKADAAYVSDVSSTAEYSEEEVKAIVSATLGYDFETAEEMLMYELCDTTVEFDRDGDGDIDATYTKTKTDAIDITGNYLDSVTNSDGRYTIYVNSYTGYVYYKDNLTGQIITSNHYNLDALSGAPSTQQELAGQLEIIFTKANDIGNEETIYKSYEWAALRAQISSARIANGIRVSYTLGNTTTNYLLPGAITAESFDEYILRPLIDAYIDLLNDYTGETYSFFDNSEYTPYAQGGIINLTGYYEVIGAPNKRTYHYGFYDFLKDTLNDADAILSDAEFEELKKVNSEIKDFCSKYELKNPVAEKDARDKYQSYISQGYDNLESFLSTRQGVLDKMYQDHPITEDDVAIYVWDKNYSSLGDKRRYSQVIINYCTELTFGIMYEEEELCNYVSKVEKQAAFRCSLEYTFNEDGTLSITLPSNSIIFDETAFSLRKITPLKYFGAGDMSTYKEGGFIFFPDGSGSIIDFKDFSGTGINVNIQSQMFGQDYCYSKITGAHREQITMPVYGVVSAVKTNADTRAKTGTDKDYVQNGFFAIIEEGAALANLGVAKSSEFLAAFTSYVPYSLDFVEPENLSVSGVKGYTKVTEAKYNGSYVTRIVMLNDSSLDNAIPQNVTYYPTTYVGMATYYRNYLKASGVIESLAEMDGGLPLYIEALGAIQVVEKFLTFPVTVSKQLTTFEQIELMYNELSNAKQTLADKSDEYEAKAAEITGDTKDETDLKNKYLEYASLYNELSESLSNITNINFKLNGFTNGGLTATYPVKLKWENVCGGKKGFKELIAAAKAANDAGNTFGVYPDFDFMYINSTALFDGIGIKNTVSRMVDNRYASKQEYNVVAGVYEMLNSMVVSADSLEGLFDKFINKYSDYGWKYVSVSTLGSDLNSNFDEDNPINRDEASKYVEKTLAKLGEYKVMLDKGNIYTVAYANHIINATVDSSRFRYSSYTVPFFGIVLHSYVNYTGSAFNYTGSPDYDLLKAIENGANLYYILCYENTSYLKEDAVLNKYYGIDYKNWFDSIVKTYNELNGLIGDLQNHEIVDHRMLIAERQISDAEYSSNMNKIIVELLGFIKEQTLEAIDAKFRELRESNNPEAYQSLKVSFNLADIKAKVKETLFLDSVSELDALGFDVLFEEEVAKYFRAEYPELSGEKQYDLVISDFEYHYNYETCPLCDSTLDANNMCTKANCANKDTVVYKYRSAYSYITGSDADDKNYRQTRYSVDNGKVVIVTYQRTVDGVKQTTKFILNYNTFAVNVKLGDTVYPISKYGYQEIFE